MSEVKTIDVFDFWKENKVSQHFKKDAMALRALFADWIRSQDIKWLEYYSSSQVISKFIGDKTGLDAVGEIEQFDDLVKVLKPVYKDYVYPKTTQTGE